jgi:GNAT superfamily N-acetyltransferase
MSIINLLGGNMSEFLVRELESEDGNDVQAMFENDSEFFERYHGYPPGAEAQSLYVAVPEGKTYEDKILIGIFKPDDSSIIGVVDLIRDFPCTHTWYVGLIFIRKDCRRSGIGARFIKTVEERVLRAGGKEIQLRVISENIPSIEFFKKNGYIYLDHRDDEAQKSTLLFSKTRFLE